MSPDISAEVTMRRSVTFLVATLVALVAPPLRASDHLDGTASSKDRVRMRRKRRRG
jgi:hypothetical protein